MLVVDGRTDPITKDVTTCWRITLATANNEHAATLGIKLTSSFIAYTSACNQLHKILLELLHTCCWPFQQTHNKGCNHLWWNWCDGQQHHTCNSLSTNLSCSFSTPHHTILPVISCIRYCSVACMLIVDGRADPITKDVTTCWRINFVTANNEHAATLGIELTSSFITHTSACNQLPKILLELLHTCCWPYQQTHNKGCNHLLWNWCDGQQCTCNSLSTNLNSSFAAAQLTLLPAFSCTRCCSVSCMLVIGSRADLTTKTAFTSCGIGSQRQVCCNFEHQANQQLESCTKHHSAYNQLPKLLFTLLHTCCWPFHQLYNKWLHPLLWNWCDGQQQVCCKFEHQAKQQLLSYTTHHSACCQLHQILLNSMHAYCWWPSRPYYKGCDEML